MNSQTRAPETRIRVQTHASALNQELQRGRQSTYCGALVYGALRIAFGPWPIADRRWPMTGSWLMVNSLLAMAEWVMVHEADVAGMAEMKHGLT